jgi:pantoate--beta-alanine ligase
VGNCLAMLGKTAFAIGGISLKTAISNEELQASLHAWRQAGDSVAFVPTMGALHQGHLDLVTQARSIAKRVVVSIFVNPAQFGPSEDFASYPRTTEQDSALLRAKGIDLLFLPDVFTIYPEGFQTVVSNNSLSSILCGAKRQGHFDGVLTVVLVLLGLVRPDFLIMGKKDFQQVHLVDRMVRDLRLGIRVVPMETTREADGLAMSSRNRYLQPEERSVAPKIYESLKAAQDAFRSGERRVERIVEAFTSVIALHGLLQLEYCEVRRKRNLELFQGEMDSDGVLFAAARLGAARLIDNIELLQGDSH